MTKEIGDSTLIDTWAATGTIIEPDLSKKDTGWVFAERPAYEFMNWIQNILGKKINHMLSRGVADWDTTTSYAIGATVNHTGSLWVALVANDASEPTGANTNWSEVQDAVTLRSELNATGTAPLYACRAWVNFNGTGTVAIRASGNVSSITDDGTGLYTVNFTTAMPDANYAIVDGAGDLAGGTSTDTNINAILAGSFQIQTRTGGAGITDRDYVAVAVFR